MAINKRIIRSNDGGAAAGGSFEIVTYSGTSAEQSFNIGFEPDIIWIKGRNTAGRNYFVFDNTGADTDFKYVLPYSTNAQEGASGVSTSDTGFTLQSSFGWNYTGITYVAWCWKAASSYSSNTNGSITTTVGANPDAGFSIVKYFGGNISNTYGHGLSSAPELIIIKNLDIVRDWSVVGTALGGDGGDRLVLNDTVAKITTTGLSGTTATTFAFEHNNSIANSANNFIAFCFHSVGGYQKVGSYSGTGASGNTITTGFEPRFIMVKSTTFNTGWIITDSVRSPSNTRSKYLFANTTGAESDFSWVDFNSDNFQLKDGDNTVNGSGQTYIYLAIA
jgi:hypothetical protein